MKRLCMLAVAVVGLAVAAPSAWAVPAKLSFAGRLSTTSGPVDGAASVTFKIFAVSTGGTALWEETHAVAADDGLVFAELGATTAFGETFAGDDAFLELTVNGELLSPRVKLLAVPYALRAASAETADSATTAEVAGKLGSLAEADVQRKISAGNGIQVNGTTVSLATTGCSNGQIWKFNGSTWACAADNDTTYTGTAPINVSGTTVSLATAGCSANQVLRFNGSSWACGAAPGFGNCTWKVNSGATNNPAAICAAGKVAISGGCLAGTIGNTLVNSKPFPNIGDGAATATGWECFFSTNQTNTAFAYCCNAN